ncbi:MAG: YidC/Oxa1 family membrane protein insertase [Candidatus Liptonbacteria bacterium]|nr:YidC/Oxa1 family membrane protein insertase [Candidatus Liptonbacteria bacterium]
MFSFLYEIFYRPIFNGLYVVLFFIYDNLVLYDIGIAIIILTLAVRIVLYPLFHKGMYHQSIMQKLQPKIKEIQEKHKNDTQKQSEALLDLYREHKVNPFSGFLFLLLQLPIFIAMYGLFRGLGDGALVALYPSIALRDGVNFIFLGLINMRERSIILIIVAVILQYFQGRYAAAKAAEDGKSKKELSTAEQVSRNMTYMMPGITLVLLWGFPSAISLYWASTTAFSILQQYIINRALSK